MKICPDNELRSLLYMDGLEQSTDEILLEYPVIKDRSELERIFDTNGYKNSIAITNVHENMFIAAEMGWLHVLHYFVNSAVHLKS